MKEAMTDEIKKARETLRSVDERLYADQNRLRAKEAQLAAARRLGAEAKEAAAALEKEIGALTKNIEIARSNLQSLKTKLSDLVGTVVLPLSPKELASQLDDGLPCLLFPVRIETRFLNRELWVRVYPDDIAVHTHEEGLTRDEADAAIDYWTERTRAASVPDPAEREQLEKGAWRALANAYGGTRASWLASVIRNRVIEKEGSEDFSFLLIRVAISNVLANPELDPPAKRNEIDSLLNSGHRLFDSLRHPIAALLDADREITGPTRQKVIQAIQDGVLTHLGFDLDELKPESWSRAARSEVMPDRFVLVGFTDGIRFEQVFPGAVPNPLYLGPNPQNLESEMSAENDDLVMGADFDWIADFDKAIAVGMAMRVALPEPFVSRGFDRLMVLGLRLSSTPADHKALLEELIDNHRYSPDGMSFLAQGTPTNHTGDERSGFSTDDAEGEASFETETTDPDIHPTSDELEKVDAQRLAEAWDVDLAKLAPLANAGRQDVSQAKIINRALWPATLGYFLSELLELDPSDIGRARTFFTQNVVGRGSLPAIRVGKQPYGVLVTSAFRKWQINPGVDGEDSSFLEQAHERLTRVEDQWQQLAGQVAHVDAPGDSFANLLNVLGLQATSVDFARRIGTYENMLWNLALFWSGETFPGAGPIAQYFAEISSRGIALAGQLGLSLSPLPKLFGLLFSANTTGINGPLIDDVASAADEKWSETAGLPRKYAVGLEDRNYIGWLVGSDTDTLKRQQLVDQDGAALPIPTALLYRMLHRSLSLSTYEATMDLYEGLQMVNAGVRREQDFTNVEAGRTVTRWEFVEAPVHSVMPQISDTGAAIGDFLVTADPVTVPAAFTLQQVRDCIGRLETLSTAELERLFAEHLDLCSYRLDAWQTALFAKRLERLNLLRDKGNKRGVHLGAYGWLENVRPAPQPAAVPIAEIPPSLRENGITVVEQLDNGGYIHGPSINHAVAAAVLRNAYLTHADENNADRFSVRLTSDRVRTALSFLEGVRNGQELGALLGYQFERALHDRSGISGENLDQFILAFRKQYPMVADKITPGDPNDAIQHKESYHVVDGYALLEAVLVGESPLVYPYGVQGLPINPADGAARAIIAEVERLGVTLDAIGDLSLAEGVFQVTQGNYERAGAMLKALSEGNAPPEPEIVKTPRSGAVVHHRLAVHFATGAVASPWSVSATPKSLASPGLNRWLGELIGAPDSLQFTVHDDLDDSITVVSLAELNLQPIDLIDLIGDQARRGEASDLTELEARIDFTFRRKRTAQAPNFDPSGRATIRFMSREGFPATDIRNLFELLPLLRGLRKLIAGSRPLGADDFTLPSEENTNANAADPKRWDLVALEAAFDQAADGLGDLLTELDTLLSAAPSGIDEDALRDLLVSLSYYGLPGAFPRRQSLVEQARSTLAEGTIRHSQAVTSRTFGNLSPEEIGRLTVADKGEIYQQAGALILGNGFRFIPEFQFKNRPELEAAQAFADHAEPDQSLLRFTHSRLKAAAANSAVDDWRSLAVGEWLAGVAAVREQPGVLDAIQTHHEAFADQELSFTPLQLPFDPKAHWVALEFPEVGVDHLDDPDLFVPRGDFVSLARQLPEDYSAASPQSGLLIDEWNETIPNRIETTGIAIHYNQPSTEPPQCVLLAVSPVVDGRWQWDDLVDTVMDTFDRAKRRGVEPDFLRTTAYAQLLPAVLTTFTRYPFATISTDLAIATAAVQQ
jgi:hypothetical protein